MGNVWNWRRMNGFLWSLNWFQWSIAIICVVHLTSTQIELSNGRNEPRNTTAAHYLNECKWHERRQGVFFSICNEIFNANFIHYLAGQLFFNCFKFKWINFNSIGIRQCLDLINELPDIHSFNAIRTIGLAVTWSKVTTLAQLAPLSMFQHWHRRLIRSN